MWITGSCRRSDSKPNILIHVLENNPIILINENKIDFIFINFQNSLWNKNKVRRVKNFVHCGFLFSSKSNDIRDDACSNNLFIYQN